MRQTEDDEWDMDGASAVTPGDRKADRSKPPSLQLDFLAFLHMLGNHIHIVGVAAKNFYSHSKEVRAIRDIMESHCVDKEAYTPEMLAYIFWHILMDSRQYFNTFAGNPISNLSVLRESLRSFVVPAPMNCPIEDLIGSRNDKRGWKE